MKCDHIRTMAQGDMPFFPNMLNNGKVEVCLKEDVDAAIAELKTENERLKNWPHTDNSTVIYNLSEELCATRRSLWLARAERAKARKDYWYVRSCHEGDKRLWSIDGSPVKYIGCIKRTNFDWLKIWSEVECKCLKKMEKYK